MDTELARTFLAVIDAGSFLRAAERLHVTQSTVSARIAQLERFLDASVFVRNKSGATLTSAGRHFEPHAVRLLQTLEQARQDLGVAGGFKLRLTVGGRFGLWEGLLLRWLQQLPEALPDLAVRVEIGFENDLMLGLIEGRVDIGAMYTPQSRPGLSVEKLCDERLVLVSTREQGAPGATPDYVYVDWGPEFYARHSANFPAFDRPRITANIGWLALQHILAVGGSAYFPRRMIAPHLARGILHEVVGVPGFTVPAYIVYATARRELDGALGLLRTIVAEVAPPPSTENATGAPHRAATGADRGL